MTKVLISEKYLHDIANAIRVKLDSQSTYTPAQMAAAIADITGSISGTITPSMDTDKVLVTDNSLTAIANAIRAKLDVQTQYTPAQMADAILSIHSAPVSGDEAVHVWTAETGSNPAIYVQHGNYDSAQGLFTGDQDAVLVSWNSVPQWTDYYGIVSIMYSGGWKSNALKNCMTKIDNGTAIAKSSGQTIVNWGGSRNTDIIVWLTTE